MTSELEVENLAVNYKIKMRSNLALEKRGLVDIEVCCFIKTSMDVSSDHYILFLHEKHVLDVLQTFNNFH